MVLNGYLSSWWAGGGLRASLSAIIMWNLSANAVFNEEMVAKAPPSAGSYCDKEIWEIANIANVVLRCENKIFFEAVESLLSPYCGRRSEMCFYFI